MTIGTQVTQPAIAFIRHEGRRFNVSCRIAFDGIEYVGRLWFSEDGTEDPGVPDRGALPGRTPEEVVVLARRLTETELELRYLRALAEKRRFVQLRRSTEEILSKIRYLNQVAITVRAGLLDPEGAAQEVELTEKQLHDCVNRLRLHAGVEAYGPSSPHPQD